MDGRDIVRPFRHFFSERMGKGRTRWWWYRKSRRYYCSAFSKGLLHPRWTKKIRVTDAVGSIMADTVRQERNLAIVQKCRGSHSLRKHCEQKRRNTLTCKYSNCVTCRPLRLTYIRTTRIGEVCIRIICRPWRWLDYGLNVIESPCARHFSGTACERRLRRLMYARQITTQFNRLWQFIAVFGSIFPAKWITILFSYSFRDTELRDARKRTFYLSVYYRRAELVDKYNNVVTELTRRGD